MNIERINKMIILLTSLLLVKQIYSTKDNLSNKELICSHNMCTDYKYETKKDIYLINQEKDSYTIIKNNKVLYKNCKQIYMNDNITECRTNKQNKKTILSNKLINTTDDIYIPKANVNTQNMFCNLTNCKILLDSEKIDIELRNNSFKVLSSKTIINEDEILIDNLKFKKEISICKDNCDYNIYNPQVINHYYKICIGNYTENCDILINLINKNSNEQIIVNHNGKKDILQPNSTIKININKINYELDDGLLGFDTIKECLSASLLKKINKIKCYPYFYKMSNRDFDYLNNKTTYNYRVVNNTLNLNYYKQLEHKKDLSVDNLIIIEGNLNEIEWKMINNNTLLLNYKSIISDKFLEEFPYIHRIIHDSNTTYNTLLINAKKVTIILDDISKLNTITIKIKSEKRFTFIQNYNNTRIIIKEHIYFENNFLKSNEKCKIGINGQISEDSGHNNCTLINILPLIKQKYKIIQSNCDDNSIKDIRNVCILNNNPTKFYDLSTKLISIFFDLIETINEIKLNIFKPKIISFEEECKILQKVDNSLKCGPDFLIKDDCIIFYNDNKKIC